jgi:hypothetical protein
LGPGADFSYIFSGENAAENFPPKMLGKNEFSAEKVLKNRFSKKFRGIFLRKVIFRGKNVQKIGQVST